jgi:hypothetical protein
MQMAVKKGRVVRTPGRAKPYKVVLENEDAGKADHPVSTVRQGEALIRKNSVPPPEEPKRDSWNP